MSFGFKLQAQVGNRAESTLLSPNKPIERTIKRGETHSFTFKLRANEYFHVDVDQHGIDVQLSVAGPDGKLLIERDRPNGTHGTEALSFISTRAGEYRLQVKALDENAEPGKYEIKSEAPRNPTATDKIRIEAETLFQEGLQLSQTRTIDSVRQACAKYETSASWWQEIGDRYAEALAQTSLGFGRERLGENEKAGAAHERALLRYRDLKDRGNEATSLMALSVINVYLQNPEAAIEQFRRAKSIFRELKEPYGEKVLNGNFSKAAEASLNAGYNLFQKQGVESYESALNALATARFVYRELEDKSNEALTLLGLGRINDALGEKQKALDFYDEAQSLYKATEDKGGEAAILNNVGRIYYDLGDNQKALDHYTRALPIQRALGDKIDEAKTLNNIGLVYYALGENQKALDHYNQALPLTRALEDKSVEATTHNNIGRVYSALGEKQKALNYHNQALSLYKAGGERYGEAAALNSIGGVYSDVGEKQKALDYYNQALPIMRALGNGRGAARTLNGIGGVYYDLGEKQKALDYYNQALPILRTIGDKHGAGATLNNIGLVYSDLGEKQKALDYYNQVLSLIRAVGDRHGEAIILNNIGVVYDNLGEKQKALDYHNQALPIFRVLGDKSGEAKTLNNMMFVWYSLKNPRLAVFYGKQSVNLYQQLRSTNQSLDKDLQKTFLKSVEATYRDLSRVLIEQGRLAEAHQILNTFKDQQYFDLNPDTTKKPLSLAMTKRESELSSRYYTTSNMVGNIQGQIEELNRTVGNRAPNAVESAKLEQLDEDLKTATNEFLATIKQAETELTGSSDVVEDKPPDVVDTREMQAALRDLSAQTKQKAVAVYTSVGEDKFLALIITPDSLIPIISSIRSKELNGKAKDFLVQLSEVNKQTNAPKFSVAEIQKTGKELYDLMFASIAAKFKEFNIRPDVLMWSLDGGLRYVPVAALYDGTQYLAERYCNVVFTRADSNRMRSQVSKTWTGSGFYNSKEYSVPVNGEMKRFPRLENARSEVETIFGVPPVTGLVDGKFLSNELFTKDTFLERLRQHLPLVHIASHFRLVPGDATSSFLLLGDGNKLTLADLNDEPNDLFVGVELLTLSACETGVQKERESDGREIDSLAELAQRKQAQAIMASLWNVDDLSTSRLMLEFYQSRQLKKLTKAEALQRAELTLLKDTRYSHPFYWSPFILVGNWR